MKTLLATLGALALTLATTEEAHAFGAKPAEPTVPVNPAPVQPAPISQQAKPYRYLELDKVTVPSFFLPNGSRVDYNIDLNALIQTKINESRYLRTRMSVPEAPSRLVITGGITSFEADVAGTNLKIGWNKGGVLVPGQTVTGEATIRLTSMSMDFLIYDRVTKATRLSASTDQTLTNLKLEVKVNLANIDLSLNSFYQQVLAEAVGRATADVMKRLENRSDFDTVFWQAAITGKDENAGVVGLSLGAADNVRVGDIYSIYTACSAEETAAGQCFSRFLADVRVTQVGMSSAQAKAYTESDSLVKIQAGDRVEVKPLVKIQ
jgi:hypothetical protein